MIPTYILRDGKLRRYNYTTHYYEEVVSYSAADIEALLEIANTYQKELRA